MHHNTGTKVDLEHYVILEFSDCHYYPEMAPRNEKPFTFTLPEVLKRKFTIIRELGQGAYGVVW
jgi:hypothetical protein